MSVQTHMVGQGTLREDNSNSSGNSFSCALSPIYPGWVFSSIPYSIRDPDESRGAGLHFPGEEIEARKKKKNGSPYMEKNRTPPTSPTTELPALMGGPEGRAQETPGTKRSLGNTNHGVAATGQ